jgi:endonuclease YncB( thermonuclease family)
VHRFVAIAFWLAIATTSARADFDGTVVGVADGDTLTVLVQRTLASLVAGRRVGVRERGRDAFGRVLAEIHVDSVNVNAEQVRRGYAWVFRRYSQDAQLLGLEAEARAAKRGLWRDDASIEPWIWRERNDLTRHRRPGADIR